MRSFTISNYHMWMLQKENKNSKRNLRTRKKSHFIQINQLTIQETTTKSVAEGRNSHTQSGSTLKHEKGPTGSNVRWGLPKNLQQISQASVYCKTNKKKQPAAQIWHLWYFLRGRLHAKHLYTHKLYPGLYTRTYLGSMALGYHKA